MFRITFSVCLVPKLSHVQLFVTTWTWAHQAPLSMGILQAQILEWVAMPFSRGSSQPRDWPQISCTACRFFILLSHQGSKETTLRLSLLLTGYLLTVHLWILYSKCIQTLTTSPYHSIANSQTQANAISFPDYCNSLQNLLLPPLSPSYPFVTLHC